MIRARFGSLNHGGLAERNAPGPVPGSALLDRSGHQPTDKLSRNRRERRTPEVGSSQAFPASSYCA